MLWVNKFAFFSALQKPLCNQPCMLPHQQLSASPIKGIILSSLHFFFSFQIIVSFIIGQFGSFNCRSSEGQDTSQPREFQHEKPSLWGRCGRNLFEIRRTVRNIKLAKLKNADEIEVTCYWTLWALQRDESSLWRNWKSEELEDSRKWH